MSLLLRLTESLLISMRQARALFEAGLSLLTCVVSRRFLVGGATPTARNLIAAVADSGLPGQSILHSESSAPVISIVIPYFNNSRHIKDCLESLDAACLMPWECILVNDGSDDSQSQYLIEFLNALGDSRIRYVHQNNLGLASARNLGLGQATGIYVKFLDADDMLLPGSVAREIHIAKTSDSEVVLSRIYYWLDGKNVLIPQQIRKIKSILESRRSTISLVFRSWEEGLTIPIHSALFLRSFIPKFEEELRNREDFAFWCDVFSLDPKVTTSDHLVGVYRLHSRQMTKGDREIQRLAFEMAIKWISSEHREILGIKAIKRKRSYADARYGVLGKSPT